MASFESFPGTFHRNVDSQPWPCSVEEQTEGWRRTCPVGFRGSLWKQGVGVARESRVLVTALTLVGKMSLFNCYFTVTWSNFYSRHVISKSLGNPLRFLVDNWKKRLYVCNDKTKHQVIRVDFTQDISWIIALSQLSWAWSFQKPILFLLVALSSSKAGAAPLGLLVQLKEERAMQLLKVKQKFLTVNELV